MRLNKTSAFGINDTLLGGSGDDVLLTREFGGESLVFGGDGNDTVIADFSFEDTLGGGNGDDSLDASSAVGFAQIFGGAGNDTLVGTLFDGDRLTGVSLLSANPGVGEVDSLIGGEESSTFVLGTFQKTFYNDGDTLTTGTDDYAIITNFQTTDDFIQLNGTPRDYVLGTSPIPTVSGTAIYLEDSAAGTNELIGIVQGVDPSSLSLGGSYFVYV